MGAWNTEGPASSGRGYAAKAHCRQGAATDRPRPVGRPLPNDDDGLPGERGWPIAFGVVLSTLLVKGLEFDHAVVIHNDNMSAKDWYVALTRASKTLRIVSPHRSIRTSIS